ncbi:MAG: hypothetical protein KAS97_08860, partial [Candidatus Aminicenantes bacterium]|nr:hypothetical protein [Candidatus Aminicenantes bacterium]
MKRNLIIGFILIFAITLTAGEGFSPDKVKIPLSFDYYYSYEMVVSAVKKLHKAYPELTRLDAVGKSEEGRVIYALTINNPKTGG